MHRYQCAAMALGVIATAVSAQNISVTIENTNDDGGFYFTPVWIGLHDGGFDTFDNGAYAADFMGITEIAENGNTAALESRFAMHGGAQLTVLGDEGPDGAPVFAPGESKTAQINVGDATTNRYLSFASMVIPSNDLFIANDNAMAYEIFDAAGAFNGPVVIEIYGADVYDNGTEANNAFGDAAFSANDGQSVPEFAVIRSFFTDGGDADYLDSFVGTDTAIGTTINDTFASGDLIARITIVPAPSAAAALAGLGLIGLRRRR